MSTRFEQSFAYVGAGTDVSPIRVFDSLRGRASRTPGFFVFIDSKPFTEWPMIYSRQELQGEQRSDEFARELLFLANALGFRIVPGESSVDLCSKDPFVICMVRLSDNSRLHYYFSTRYPNDLVDRPSDLCMSKLARDLSACSTLILSGYDPHKCILDSLCKDRPLRIWAMEHMCYGRDQVDPDRIGESLVEAMHENTSGRVDSIEFIRQCYEKTHVRSLSELCDFVRLSESAVSNHTVHGGLSDWTL